MSASLPSTTKEPTFESLVEEFREAVRSAVLYRHAESYERKCRSALLDYVRKLEADRSRLDWLESHRLTLDFDGACRWPWSVYDEQAGGEGARLRGEGDTIREAIDSARRISRSAPQLKDK